MRSKAAVQMFPTATDVRKESCSPNVSNCDERRMPKAYPVDSAASYILIRRRKFSMTSAVACMGCHVIAKHDLIRRYALMQQAAAPEVPGTENYISGSTRATRSSAAWTSAAGADTEYCIIQRGRMIDSLDG